VRCTNLAVIIFLEFILISRQSKVTKLNFPIIIDEHVLALEVAVEKLPLVQIEESQGDLLSDPHYFIIVKGYLLLVE